MNIILANHRPAMTNDIATHITGIIKERQRTIIGVYGASCSGKSTFADQLHYTCGSKDSLIIPVDNYWKYPRAEMVRMGLTGYDRESRDHARLIRDLGLLKNSHAIDMPLFDYQQEKPSPYTTRVFSKSIIIIEGTLDFTDIADLTIFTYAPENTLIQRRLQRDAYKTGFANTQELETYLRTKSIPAYKSKLLPIASRADYIIDTSTNKLYVRK